MKKVIRKIRKGNDISVYWKIREIEDLTEAENIKLFRYVGVIGRMGLEIPFKIIGDNIIRIEVTPKIANIIGEYIFQIFCQLPNLNNADGDEKFRIDTNAFEIVSRTFQEDDEGSYDVFIGYDEVN